MYICIAGRNPDYLALNVQLTIDVITAAGYINLFPDILKPYGYICTTRI